MGLVVAEEHCSKVPSEVAQEDVLNLRRGILARTPVAYLETKSKDQE